MIINRYFSGQIHRDKSCVFSITMGYEMICDTILMPVIFPCVALGIHKVSPKFNRFLSEAIEVFCLTLGMSVYLIIALIQHGTEFFSLTTRTQTAFGWTIDLVCLLCIANTAIKKINISFLLPNVLIVKALKTRGEQKTFTFMLAGTYACVIQLLVWLPLVYKWSQSHCLIDGFIDTSNNPSTYIVLTITLTYFKMLCQMLVELPRRTETNDSKTCVNQDLVQTKSMIKFWLISIVAFYNITFGGFLYLLL
jgi:hypothetical protein